jgi:DNA transformation protein and related proteins
MKEVRGYRFYVRLGASQARKRLANLGFGVRKVETAGRGRALIIHTATGQHRRDLYRLFDDVLEPDDDGDPPA